MSLVGEKKRYLVTGGCGFVGTNLLRSLVDRARHIRVFDNLTTGRSGDIKDLDVELIHGDVRDGQAVGEAVRGIDVVIHLAAHTSVVESQKHVLTDFDVNVRGTLNCLDASHRAGVERFIFASTGGAIVGDRTPPVHEEMAPRPRAPYGASKLAGEAYCSAFWGSYGLPTVALRFSNVYGPYSYGKASVVATFVKRILSGQPLTVYGDGTQTRDFLFVADLCEAVLLSCETTLPWGRAFHIASGTETRIIDLIAELRRVGDGRTIEVNFAPPRAGEVHRNWAAIDAARLHLGFSPGTRLSEGLATTWNWFATAQQDYA